MAAFVGTHANWRDAAPLQGVSRRQRPGSKTGRLRCVRSDELTATAKCVDGIPRSCGWMTAIAIPSGRPCPPSARRCGGSAIYLDDAHFGLGMRHTQRQPLSGSAPEPAVQQVSQTRQLLPHCRRPSLTLPTMGHAPGAAILGRRSESRSKISRPRKAPRRRAVTALTRPPHRSVCSEGFSALRPPQQLWWRYFTLPCPVEPAISSRVDAICRAPSAPQRRNKAAATSSMFSGTVSCGFRKPASTAAA
jgi:hypothetical protein